MRQRRADQAWAQARDESALPSGNTAYRRLPDFEAALKALAVRVPGAREADHAVAPVVRGPRHRRHRDHARPARAGRQADLPEHRDPSRPRVAVGRASARVRLRPAAQDYGKRRACDTARRPGADDRRPDREPGRLQRVPRGAERPRGPALQRTPTSSTGARTAAWRRAPPLPSTARRCRARSASTSTATTRASGAGRARARTRGRHVPRRGPGVRARGAGDPRPHRDAPDHQPHHQPHVLEPRPAPTGRGGGRLLGRRAAVPRPRPPDVADTNGYANIPSFQLYDTTGATEDWSYWTAGGLGFTFEIGDEAFHPEFSRRGRRRVPGPRARRRGGQGRQPRGVLPDARGDGRRRRTTR